MQKHFLTGAKRIDYNWRLSGTRRIVENAFVFQLSRFKPVPYTPDRLLHLSQKLVRYITGCAKVLPEGICARGCCLWEYRPQQNYVW
jgi:hypothetical protein